MTDQDPGDGTARPLAAELRLRPNRPSVTRLSRRVLIGLGTVASLSIFGLTYWALQSRGVKPESPELYNTQSQNIADGVTSLPSSYNDLPKPTPPLGPPLPGDLGPPILHAEQQGSVSTSNDQPISNSPRSRIPPVRAACSCRMRRQQLLQAPAKLRALTRSRATLAARQRPTLPPPRTCRTKSSPS